MRRLVAWGSGGVEDMHRLLRLHLGPQEDFGGETAGKILQDEVPLLVEVVIEKERRLGRMKGQDAGQMARLGKAFPVET